MNFVSPFTPLPDIELLSAKKVSMYQADLWIKSLMGLVPWTVECSDEAAVLLMYFQLGLKSEVSVHSALDLFCVTISGKLHNVT